MLKKRQIQVLFLALALALSTLLVACEKKEDTRQYIHTIGIVVTNDINNIFDEMYVYPAGNIHEMGPDCIQNSGTITRVGSYGATVEESDAYGITVRDNRGGVYMFDALPLQNADHAVISYTEEALLVTIYHRSGGVDEVEGQYVAPGDAPDQPYVPLQKQVTYQFTLQNDTDSNLSYITMREAADQEKGEVELSLDTLLAHDDTSIHGRLYEEDEDITEWVLYIETDDGTYAVTDSTFNPWTTDTLVITQEGSQFDVTAS